MKGKVKWIVIGILIALVISAIAVFVINEVQLSYKIEEIKEINYAIVTHSGKYGVIDKSGSIVVEPVYVAIQIPNPSKPIFICIEGYNEELKEYQSKVLNDKNEQLFTEYEAISAIPIETNIEASPYEKSNLAYKKDGKYGLINLEGEKITEPIYDEITSVHYKEGSFIVNQDGKMGVINLKGKVIIKPEYETIASDNYYNEKTQNKTTGYIVSKKTEEGYNYGYINYRGKVILNTEYTELERVTGIANEKELYFIAFKDGQAGILKGRKLVLNHEYQDIQYNSLNDVFIVQRNSKQGVVSKKGDTIVNTEYDTILFGGMYIDAKKGDKLYLFDLNGASVENKNIISKTATENPNYYIAIDENDIYSIIDKDGNVLVDNDYSYIEYLPGDHFIVAKDGKNGVIDISGKSAIDISYTSIFRLNDTNLIQAERVDTKTIDLYNMEMYKVASLDNATITTSDNYIMLASDKDFAYYDFSGNKLNAKDVFPNNQLFAKKINDKWGFVDKDGNIVIENKYEMVTDFNQYGFAGVKLDGKWGVIEQSTKNLIQEPIYKLDWNQPTFLGKYYRIKVWYGDAKYSDEVEGND